MLTRPGHRRGTVSASVDPNGIDSLLRRLRRHPTPAVIRFWRRDALSGHLPDEVAIHWCSTGRTLITSANFCTFKHMAHGSRNAPPAPDRAQKSHCTTGPILASVPLIAVRWSTCSDLLVVVILPVDSLRLLELHAGSRDRDQHRVAYLRPEMRVHPVMEAGATSTNADLRVDSARLSARAFRPTRNMTHNSDAGA